MIHHAKAAGFWLPLITYWVCPASLKPTQDSINIYRWNMLKSICKNHHTSYPVWFQVMNLLWAWLQKTTSLLVRQVYLPNMGKTRISLYSTNKFSQKEDSSNAYSLFGNSYTTIKVDILWSCFEKMSVSLFSFHNRHIMPLWWQKAERQGRKYTRWITGKE